MLYWMDHRNYHRAGTPIDCSCLICSGFAENDEVVAVEDFIDVGNILGKSWVSLYVICLGRYTSPPTLCNNSPSGFLVCCSRRFKKMHI